jgi:hypothetical protein
VWVGQFIGASYHYTVIDFIAWVPPPAQRNRPRLTRPLFPHSQVPHFTKFVCRCVACCLFQLISRSDLPRLASSSNHSTGLKYPRAGDDAAAGLSPPSTSAAAPSALPSMRRAFFPSPSPFHLLCRYFNFSSCLGSCPFPLPLTILSLITPHFHSLTPPPPLPPPFLVQCKDIAVAEGEMPASSCSPAVRDAVSNALKALGEAK